jgi:hypothetical protein
VPIAPVRAAARAPGPAPDPEVWKAWLRCSGRRREKSPISAALQPNVHFHVLVPDGAFDAHCARERSELAKCPVPTDDRVVVAAEAPDDDDVRNILLRAGRRMIALLSRFFADEDERRHEVDRLLQQLDASSARPKPSLFPRPERRARSRRSSRGSRSTSPPACRPATVAGCDDCARTARAGPRRVRAAAPTVGVRSTTTPSPPLRGSRRTPATPPSSASAPEPRRLSVLRW